MPSWMLGVYKAISEWFIHQWRSVPSCHALSLPTLWHVCAARRKGGGGVRGTFAVCAAPVPVSLCIVLGDQRGREAGDVFAPPPDPGRRPWPPAQPSASRGRPRQTLPRVHPWQQPRHGPEYPLSLLH